MLPKDINNITEPVYKRLKKEIEDVKENSSAVINASNIRALSDDELNALKVGDVVQKITGEQKHCYVVSYKQEEHGICLTYVDAGYMETVSYDYTDGHWVYNSTDVVEVKDPESAPSGTIQDALGLDSEGKLVKGAVSGGTKLYMHKLEFSEYPSSITLSELDLSTGTITASTPSVPSYASKSLILVMSYSSPLTGWGLPPVEIGAVVVYSYFAFGAGSYGGRCDYIAPKKLSGQYVGANKVQFISIEFNNTCTFTDTITEL